MVSAYTLMDRTVGKLGRRSGCDPAERGLEEELVGLHRYRRVGSQSDPTWGVMRCDRRPPLGLGSGPCELQHPDRPLLGAGKTFLSLRARVDVVFNLLHSGILFSQQMV